MRDSGVDIVDALQVVRFDANLNPIPFNGSAADIVGCVGNGDIVGAFQIAQYDPNLIETFECS